jgi:hypothetical protein
VNDLIATIIVFGFFGLAAAYVSWCERIVENDWPDISGDEREAFGGAHDPTAAGTQS